MKGEAFKAKIVDLLTFESKESDFYYELGDFWMFRRISSINPEGLDIAAEKELKVRSYVDDYAHDGRSRDLQVLTYKGRPFAIFQYRGRGSVEEEEVFNKEVYEKFNRDYFNEYLSKVDFGDDITDIESEYVVTNYNMSYYEVQGNQICSYADDKGSL